MSDCAKRLTLFWATLAGKPRVRAFALTLLYLAIILALIVLYGKGDFSTPPFIYQGY